MLTAPRRKFLGKVGVELNLHGLNDALVGIFYFFHLGNSDKYFDSFRYMSTIHE